MKYRVVKTLVSPPLPDKETAKQIALLYREQGFGSEVITEEEYMKRSNLQGQDLTRL